MVFRVAGDDASRISMREFGEEVPPATLTNLPQFTAYVRTVVGREVVAPFAVETRPMPDGDACTRAEVLSARSKYSLPYGEATAAAHRAMNVILQHFGTEVAAATAIHDGAFGDLIGKQLEFPPPAEGDLPAAGVGMRGARREAGSQQARSQRQGGQEGNAPEADEAQGSPDGPGRSPRDRMLDMLDRIEGWMGAGPDGSAEETGEEHTQA
jgi:hypothetical protein